LRAVCPRWSKEKKLSIVASATHYLSRLLNLGGSRRDRSLASGNAHCRTSRRNRSDASNASTPRLLIALPSNGEVTTAQQVKAQPLSPRFLFCLSFSGLGGRASRADSDARGAIENEFNSHFLKRPLKVSQSPIMGHSVPGLEMRNRTRRHFRERG
jgi:hypothetical protein